MKRLFFIAMFILSFTTIYAQEDVTKFLGIPVDGTKPEMIKKLIEKGYTYDKESDLLKGEFNGYEVVIGVATNNNKVYRIFVADKNGLDEAHIRIRYNTLYEQFKNNPKYTSLEDYSIPEDENIGYEMIIHNKIYSATFYQKPETSENEVKNYFNESKSKFNSKYSDINYKQLSDSEKKNLEKELTNDIISLLSPFFQKQVWFAIQHIGGQYHMYIYYDNLRNKANGEDL
ncbi:MAG: hypothetical protein J6C80_07500 [Flavobacteriales bacterium]|nr:hypothetical protein [Flavobacteriales bacterium]